MSGRRGRAIGRISAALIAGVLVIAGVVAFQERQHISDAIAAARFTPSPGVSELVEKLDLTDAGRRVFFASEPTLDASQYFNEQCAEVDHSEEGHVLGCYTRSRIHLFKVTDERLTGIVEVTAAHELLHAVFARLGDGERERLIALLQTTYTELSATNPELEERMGVYGGLSERGFANELHSVLGTEVRDLPESLEAHYAEWFEDRALIVDAFDGYHHVFSDLRERAAAIEEELRRLRSDIEGRSAEYEAAVAAFNAEWDAFLARNEAFEFSDSPETFYALRGDFEARRTSLNADLATLNVDIAAYEALRSELQQLSQLSLELQDNLNSDLAPPALTPTT